MENMKKALELARTLPCACSDCGMRETESAKKILEFAESLSGSVAAPKEEMHLRHKLELGREIDSLRQQLEQKTTALDSYYKLAAEVAPLKEALKELIEISERYVVNLKAKAIIERARNLISK